MRSRVYGILLLVLLSMGAFAANRLDATYQGDYAKWRAGYTEDLKKNWLTLVGLFWLKDGTNRIGGDQNDEVPLPAAKAAPQIGTIDFHAGHAMFRADPHAKITSDGRPVKAIELKPDTTDKPTMLHTGDLTILMIQREQKYGIRVRDARSPAVAEFKGLDFYPVNSNFVVKAKFVPEAKPRKVGIPTVLGQNAQMDSAGYVEFTLNGQKQRLHALTEGTSELFFIFKDPTAGHGTYPAGRFLYADPPKNGTVVLDFNRAHNPPCAWTAYATCPLPPKENYLSVAVEAGEKFNGHH